MGRKNRYTKRVFIFADIWLRRAGVQTADKHRWTDFNDFLVWFLAAQVAHAEFLTKFSVRSGPQILNPSEQRLIPTLGSSSQYIHLITKMHSHNKSHWHRWTKSHWSGEFNSQVSVREGENHSKRARAQHLLPRKATNWPILYHFSCLIPSTQVIIKSGRNRHLLQGKFASLHLFFYTLYKLLKRTQQKKEVWVLQLLTFVPVQGKEEQCPVMGKEQGTKRSQKTWKIQKRNMLTLHSS